MEPRVIWPFLPATDGGPIACGLGQIGRVVNELFKFVAAGSELVELNGVHRSDLACRTNSAAACHYLSGPD
jgi:hypothetical protein